MPCYHPLTAFTSKGTKSNGKKAIHFNPSGNIQIPITLPCGQCIGCKLERSRQWAVRMQYEADQNPTNCFITLTYDEEHLPGDFGLRKTHFQKFMKRLRKHVAKNYNQKVIKFYHCGEYGEENLRPHYHAIIFNHDFDDRILHSDNGPEPLYTSAILTQLWGKGFASVGEANYKSAAYCARYVTKKITGEQAINHYERFDRYTGEITWVIPEYSTSSQYLGKGWYDKYKSDVYPSDEVIINYKRMKPPKYFDKLLEEENPTLYKKLKQKRLESIDFSDQTDRRLADRKTVKLAAITQLKRSL